MDTFLRTSKKSVKSVAGHGDEKIDEKIFIEEEKGLIILGTFGERFEEFFVAFGFGKPLN